VQGAAPPPLLELRLGKRTNDGGRIAKGADAVGRFAVAFEDVRDALQSCDGVVAAGRVGWVVRIDPYILRLQSPELRLRRNGRGRRTAMSSLRRMGSPVAVWRGSQLGRRRDMARYLVTYHGSAMSHEPEAMAQARSAFIGRGGELQISEPAPI
jgi:hypothetical protein